MTSKKRSSTLSSRRRVRSSPPPSLNHAIFKRVADQIGDELIIISDEGIILYANKATCRALGYSRRYVCHKHVTRFYKTKVSPREWKQIVFERIKASPVPIRFKLTRVGKGKVEQVIDVSASCVSIDGQDYIISIARDITETVRVEEQLKTSENQFQLMSEGAADGLVSVDLSGRITYINKTLTNLMDRKVTDILGRHFQRFVARSSRPIAETCFNLALKGIQGIREEMNILHRQGHEIPVEVNISPLYKNKRIIAVHAVVRDIRKRRETDKLIRESERLYRGLFEEANDALILSDFEGRILGGNHQAEILFGHDRLSLIGRSLLQLFPEESREEFWKILNKSKRHPTKPVDMKVFRRERFPVPVSVQVRKIKVAGRSSLLTRFTDLSERLKQEEQLREMKKVEALNHFIAGTAQEIKHPLTAVLRKTRRLSQSYRDREFEYIGYKEFRDIIQTIEKVNAQVENCCAITDKLLALRKGGSRLTRKECPVNDVIREMIKMRKDQLQEVNITFKTKLDAALPPAAVPVHEFDQVLNHLVNNSIQAMPSGGIIRIKTRRKKVGAEGFGRVQIEFSDEGIGMSKEVLPHIFEPFFSAPLPGKARNAGLGLSIVDSILRASRGTIAVRSSLRKGSVFTVTLPVAGRLHKKKKKPKQRKK